MKGNAYIPFMRRKGDGSTLNLDFTTMSALDSRLTFSRTSNATYINSSGYVAYADSNIAINTAWLDTNTTPTGWTVYNGAGTPAVLTIPSSGRRSMTVTSGVHSFLYQALTVPAGFTHTASIIVHSVTGTGPQLGTFFAINSGTISTYYKDGSSTGITSSTIVTAGTYAITFTGGDQIRLVGASGGAASTFTVEISSVQIQIGTTISPAFVPNTSTSAAYYAPRFDYDPTTLASKGLLIEGAATNLLNFSESFATTGGTNNNWANTNLTRTSTNNTSPRNDDTALRLTASAANGTIISSAAIGTSAERTLSVWLRRVTGTGNIQYTLDNGSTYTTQAITAAWVRYTFATTTAAQRVGFRIVTSADAIEIWGAQLETGTAASSYIPTVASQLTRSADLALMTSTNFSSWFTGGTTGTFFVDWHGGVRGLTSTVRSVISTDDLLTKHLHLQQASAAGVLKVADFGAAHSVSTANTITSGARTKGAFNFVGSTSTVNLCLNGGTVATSSAIAFSVAPTWLVLGGVSSTGTSITDANTVLNGSIRQIKYYPTALTSAQLIAMTT